MEIPALAVTWNLIIVGDVELDVVRTANIASDGCPLHVVAHQFMQGALCTDAGS